MVRIKKIGWGYHEDLYSAALILTERDERPREDIPIAPRKPWQPVIRVSDKVVRRRRER